MMAGKGPRLASSRHSIDQQRAEDTIEAQRTGIMSTGRPETVRPDPGDFGERIDSLTLREWRKARRRRRSSSPTSSASHAAVSN